MSQDDAVIATNNDAALSKRFAVHLGYWKDDYIQYFIKLGERKPPEINRGYYARVKGVSHLLDQFLKVTNNHCQVINLGAGFDTTYWKLRAEGKVVKGFFDVDFPAVTNHKIFLIKSKRPLMTAFQNEDVKIGKDELHADHYHIVPGDLRDVQSLEARLLAAGLDKSLPTLLVAECVLVYMNSEDSAKVIEWAGKTFPSGIFINYEQINMDNKFGQVMRQNLKGRGCDLVGALSCADNEAQIQRFLTHGWSEAQALDMWEVYNSLPAADKGRVERLEFLDEVDLLHQLLRHYCISWACNDPDDTGFCGIGFP